MAVKIRLKRMGKIRTPYYRIVVVDSRKKRDGRVIEEIGKYHPKLDPSVMQVESERVLYWLGVGAQPSEAVAAILKVTGDWQTFKGEPGTEGTLRVAEPKRDKAEIFNEALKESANEPKAEAVTKKKATKKSEAPAAEAKEAPEADAKTADADKAEEVKTDAPAKKAKAVETPEAATEEVKAPSADKAEEKPAEEKPADKADGSSDNAGA